jgi:hypothetical protein
MFKALSLLALLLVTFPQRNARVIPTKITADPIPFRKGDIVTFKASFGQTFDSRCPSASPVLKDLTDGFAIRIYDEKDVPGEPSADLGKETKFIAFTNATVNPKSEDDRQKVERDFEPVKIPSNAPSRIYVVVWRMCNWNELFDPTKVPPIYKPARKPTRYGGQFYKFECTGSADPRRPSGLCAYRPE